MSDISDLVISTEGIELAPGIEFQFWDKKEKEVVTEVYIIPIVKTDEGIRGFYTGEDLVEPKKIGLYVDHSYFAVRFQASFTLPKLKNPPQEISYIPLQDTGLLSPIWIGHQGNKKLSGRVANLLGIDGKPVLFVHNREVGPNFSKVFQTQKGLCARFDCQLETDIEKVREYLKKYKMDEFYRLI